MKPLSNHSVEGTGASRLAQSEFLRQWRLAPAAHAGRYPSVRRLWLARPDGYTSSSGLVASPNLGRRTLSLSNIVK